MMLRRCFGRPSSLARRGANSSGAWRGGALHRGAVDRLAAGRALAASASTSSALQLPSTVHGGGGCSALVADNCAIGKLQIDTNKRYWGARHDLRAFSSSADAAGDVDGVDKQIISLAESGDIAKAEEALHKMQSDAVSQNNAEGFPDIDSYTALMNACIDEQRRLISAIEDETHEIEMDANATMPNEHGTEANEQGAAAIMTLSEKAHDLLIQMEDLSGVSDHYSSMRLSGSMNTDLRDPSLKPTSHHYDSVILAFAHAVTTAHDTHYTSHSTKNAPYIAQRWLGRMETLAFDPQSGVTPTVDTYFHVMEACAASDTAASATNQKSKGPVLAQAVFDKLTDNTTIYPTAREYRLMMNAWVTSSGHRAAAYKAMGLWMAMQKSFRGGADDMEPTLEDGKMVLEAWTRSINKHSARRAQTVLFAMEALHSSKKTKVQPDLDCYRHVLTTMSHSKVPAVGTNIPKLFKSMEDNQIQPDTACFDLAIETLRSCARYSKDSFKEKYSVAAERMLERMEKERDRSSVSLVVTSGKSYTNAIQALAERGTKRAAEKADVFLQKMEREYEEGDETMKPTRDSYVGTIHAYGSCGSESSFVHANDVLQRMIAQHAEGNEEARPDVASFHAVIRACSRAAEATDSLETQKEALLLAISTVQYMKTCDTNHPNAATYRLLLQSCASLLPAGPEREKALRSIFRSCCRDGLVNKWVLKEFQSNVSTEIYHREVVRDAPSYNGTKSLPETWTRHLGYRVRTHETEDGIRKRSPIISVGGEVVASTAYSDHRMRRRWEKKNQKLLQGGRS
ncbi:hypothetical protein ACHAXT_007194 [Thalassiosira profunda]